MARLLTLFNRQEWTPASLSGLAATVLPALSRSQGKLWQDTAKTIAATADGDPVRVAVCPYTAVEFTAPSDATRPLLYEEGGGKWSLSFDGVDDRMAATGGPTGTSRTLAWSVLTPSAAAVAVVQLGTPLVTGDISRPLYVPATPKVALQGNISDIDPAWATVNGTVETGIWFHSATSKYAKNSAALSSVASTVSSSDGNIYLGSSETAALLWDSRIRGVALANGTQTDAALVLLQTYMGTL